MSKSVKCNNTLCDYCVRSNTQIVGSYICVHTDVDLEIDSEDNLNDDYVKCLSFEPRSHKKFTKEA